MNFIDELFNLKGRTAAVIGGGGVLAGAMALGLAKAGANIAILDLNRENADKRADEIRKIGSKAIAIAVDATSKQQLQQADEKICSELGPVSILINAPGINSSTPPP